MYTWWIIISIYFFIVLFYFECNLYAFISDYSHGTRIWNLCCSTCFCGSETISNIFAVCYCGAYFGQINDLNS